MNNSNDKFKDNDPIESKLIPGLFVEPDEVWNNKYHAFNDEPLASFYTANRFIKHYTDRFDLIIVHGNCIDGTCAAHILKTDKTEIFFAVYNQSLPDVKGRSVLMVDFAPSREIAIQMKIDAAELIILDHHNTNEESLKGLDFAVFDQSRAGCQLAWDYKYRMGYKMTDAEINANKWIILLPARPWYVDYVADRDLWEWKLPNSREISKAMLSGRLTSLYGFDKLKEIDPNELALIGKNIIDYESSLLSSIAKTATKCRLIKDTSSCIGGVPISFSYKVVLCQCPFALISECGEYLYDNTPDIDFVCMYQYDPIKDITFVSLRSSASSILDLGQVCKQFGGGGHAKAAGFQIKGQSIFGNYFVL